MTDPGLQRNPKNARVCNCKNSIVQYRIDPDIIISVPLPADHLLLRNPDIDPLLRRF